MEFLFFEGVKANPKVYGIEPKRDDVDMGAPLLPTPFSVLSNPGTEERDANGVVTKEGTGPGEGPPVTLDIGSSITSMFTNILSGLKLIIEGFQVGVVNPFAFDLTVYDYEFVCPIHPARSCVAPHALFCDQLQSSGVLHYLTTSLLH